MKTLTFKYRKPTKNLLAHTIQNAIDGKGKIEDDVIYVTDLSLFAKILSDIRREILACIQIENPQSIYELAQKLGKDQGYISKEIKALNGLGLIDLVSDVKDGRERLLPVLKFDRIVIDASVDLTDTSYYKKASNQ